MKTLSSATILLITAIFSNVYGEIRTNRFVPNGSVSFSLQERYVAMRTSRRLHNGLSLASEMNVRLSSSGFYLNVWDHAGLENRKTSKQPDEIDLTVGWRKNLPKLGLETGLSLTYINNSPLDLWWERDVLAPAITLAKEYVFGKHTLKPQLRVEWLAQATDVGEGVTLLMPNVSHAWKQPFGIKPLSLAHQAFLIHDDGFNLPRNDSEGYFFRWHAGLKWRLNEKATLTLPGFTALIPIHRGQDGRGQVTSWGSALSLNF
jgi:hypothetical protein